MSRPPESGELVVNGPQGVLAIVPLGELTLGRALSADVYLADDQARISRQHARVVSDGQGKWLIEDLGSRNGTKVNGSRVRQHELQDGDLITIGSYELTVHLNHAADSTPHGNRVSGTRDLSEPLTHTARGRSEGRQSLAEKELDVLQRMIRTLSEAGSATQVQDEVCPLLVEALDVRVAALVEADETPNAVPEAVAWHGAQAEEEAPPLVSRSLVRSVVAEGVPMLGSVGGRVQGSLKISVETSPELVVGAAPIEVRADRHLLLYVVASSSQAGDSFVDFLGTLATQVAMSLRLARQVALTRDMELARRIQQRSLPQSASTFGALEIEYHYRPCVAVGGDLVDIWSLPNGRVMALVADVSGKGLSAALLVANLQALLRAGSAATDSIATTIQAANQYLIERTPEAMFATLVALVVDPQEGRMQIINAGHLPPLLLDHAQQRVSQLDQVSGLPLGIADEPYPSFSTELKPGQSVIIVSDGITEVANEDGQQLGLTGLTHWAESQVHSHPKPPQLRTLIHALTEHCDTHAGRCPAMDDRTILALRHRANTSTSRLSDSSGVTQPQQ